MLGEPGSDEWLKKKEDACPFLFLLPQPGWVGSEGYRGSRMNLTQRRGDRGERDSIVLFLFFCLCGLRASA